MSPTTLPPTPPRSTATGVKSENLSALLDLSGTTHTDAGALFDRLVDFAGNVKLQERQRRRNGPDREGASTIAITWVNSVDTNPHPASAVVNGVGGQANLQPPRHTGLLRWCDSRRRASDRRAG